MKLYLISLLLLIIGCKKSQDPLLNFKNNNISIKVSSAAGAVANYNYHGELAPMYQSAWGVDFGAEGKTSPTDTQIWITQSETDFYGPKFSCVFTQPSGNTYYSPTTNPGTVTFTKHTADQAEGSFNAKCGNQGDTLMIQRTFSGHYN